MAVTALSGDSTKTKHANVYVIINIASSSISVSVVLRVPPESRLASQRATPTGVHTAAYWNFVLEAIVLARGCRNSQRACMFFRVLWINIVGSISEPLIYAAMRGAFSLDPSVMSSLRVSGGRGKSTNALNSSKTIMRRRNQYNEKNEVFQSIQRGALSKFYTVCRAVNVDPVCIHSLCVVTILMSRYRDRVNIARAYVAARPECENMNVDWDAAASPDQLSGKFSSISDWVTIFEYLQPMVTEDKLEDMAKDPLISGFSKSMKVGGLSTQYISSVQLSMSCIMYMSPVDTPSGKMLERLLVTLDNKCKDIEVKCLRTVTHFLDQTNDHGVAATTFGLVIDNMVAKPAFTDDMLSVVEEQARLDQSARDESESYGNVNRFRLREFVRKVHREGVLEYTQTFSSWCATQRFTATTGYNVQLLLYFISVQDTQVSLADYAGYFTRGLVDRLKLQRPDSIDAEAVILVIKSLRVYHENIDSLLEFRTQCLSGLNITAQRKLSLSQALQLYVCMFQHNSIRDKCWKAVVPTLNHTIATACEKFRKTNTYEIKHVIDSFIRCQEAA